MYGKGSPKLSQAVVCIEANYKGNLSEQDSRHSDSIDQKRRAGARQLCLRRKVKLHLNATQLHNLQTVARWQGEHIARNKHIWTEGCVQKLPTEYVGL